MLETDIRRAEIECRYNIRELCKSGISTEIKNEGKKFQATLFPLDDVSYYPRTANFPHPLDYQAHLAMADVMGCNPDRPFGHTDVKGNVIVFEKDSQFLALLDIKEVNDRMNEKLSLAIVTPKALTPHPQEIVDCNSGGLFGHIYTIDSDNSRWSLHVEKPNSPPETKEEFFTQEKLL